ncbi:hypothetical protein BDY21DRAFT_348757 [Lineolata rhizophorae]|uniref:Uncharacterized protein n=1 Tax=Lineolata rhizophorae TaxID=578093 RepID=A0A6A6NVP8_9PEZI|nr:hypothetical protein BDY21DRAFT_348757 [Lineolata rhizophorae]
MLLRPLQAVSSINGRWSRLLSVLAAIAIGVRGQFQSAISVPPILPRSPPRSCGVEETRLLAVQTAPVSKFESAPSSASDHVRTPTYRSPFCSSTRLLLLLLRPMPPPRAAR